MTEAIAAKATTFPVVEVFGPTIQGEGALAGLPTLFVRFGFCDYRCSWCDSMFAVEPAEVQMHAERMTQEQLVGRVIDQHWQPGIWLTLSGGNPAIHDLGGFVREIRSRHYRVAVETQGSVWRTWLKEVDHLVVSPKPPSSGMVSDRHTHDTSLFLDKAQTWIPDRRKRSMKIVVFDEADLDWARDLIEGRKAVMEWWDTFLSVGTDPIHRWGSEVTIARSRSGVLRGVAERYAWLCEQVAGDPVFTETRVLPQMHVLAWGHARGV